MRPTRTNTDSEEDFQTPSRQRDQTDYSLDYTGRSRGSRIVNPNGPSTSRAAAAAVKRQQTSKISQQRGRQQQEQLSPSTQESSPERRSTRNTVQRSITTADKTRNRQQREQLSQSTQESSPERRSTRNTVQRSVTTADQTRNRQQQSHQQQKTRRKQRNPLSAAERMNREIRYLQNRGDYLIPKAPFGRLVREIMMDCGTGEVRKIMSSALETLQETSELYLTQVLADAYMLTLHRQRVTLMPKDIQLLRLIKLLN